MLALRLSAVVPFALLLASCEPRPTRLSVPLTFRATSTAAGHGMVASVSPDVRLFLAPVADRRSSAQVGENIENQPSVPITTQGSPPAFVREVVGRELSESGYRLVDEASANRVLAITLTKFFTTESSNYATEVRCEIEVRSPDGAVLFHGAATGSDSRFGRSLSRENYEEGWSAATLDLARSIVGSGAFVHALTAAPPSKPVPEAAPPTTE